jgi:hypothetical protein
MPTANSTITSANSIFTIVVPGLFPAPVQLEGYSSDKAVITDAIAMAETMMGVDGLMAAGYVPAITKQTISLMANSPSRSFFTAIALATQTAQEVFQLIGALDLPSTGESFIMPKGYIVNMKKIPDLMKVLGPVEIVIDWQSVTPNPL